MFVNYESPLASITIDAKLYSKYIIVHDNLNIYDDVISMNEWFNLWQLRLNLNIYKVLHLGWANKNFNYFLEEKILKNVESFCDLGLTTTSDMSSNKNCAEISIKAYFCLYILNRCFANMDVEFILFSYMTYIRKLLENNTVLWSPNKIPDIDRIERVQWKFTKLLHGMYNLSYNERLR